MTDVIKALEQYLNRPVIYADQAAPKPPYPYIAIKITSQHIPSPISIKTEDLERDIKQTAYSLPTMVLSVTEYSDDLAKAGKLAQQAHDWFSFSGHRKIKDAGFVVVDVGAISNRDSQIVDDYERRRGFDVTLRFVHSVERFVETIEIVAGKLRGHDYEVKRSE